MPVQVIHLYGGLRVRDILKESMTTVIIKIQDFW
jgi:hypothetical protein